MLFQANGGSKELIKMMNRVGAVASNDTLQRHIESVSVYRLQKGLTHELNLNALAIVSVDNIDFLQSNAFVYSGDVSRSWHGTTIQVVQPTPSFVIIDTFPIGWLPDIVILEGMFLINTMPLRIYSKISEY